MNPTLPSAMLPPVVTAKSPTPAGRTADPVDNGDDPPSFDKVMNGVANRTRTEREKPTEDSPPAASARDTPAAPATPTAGDTPPATEASAPPTDKPADPAHPPGWLVAMAHGAGQQSAAVAASGNPVLTSGQRGGIHTVMDAAAPTPTAGETAEPQATGRPGANGQADPSPMGQALGLDPDRKAALPPGVMTALAHSAKADAATRSTVDNDNPPRPNGVGSRAATLVPDTPLASAPGNAAATPAVLNSAAFAAVLDKEHPGARSDKDSPPGLINGLGGHTPTVALADGETGTVYRSTLQAHPASPAFPAELASEVKLLMKNGLQQAELRMNPAELGPIRIDLTLTGQTADIAFSAAHAATREGIAQSLSELRDMLGSQGIGLGQTQVGADTPQQQATPREAGQQAQPVHAAASARLGAAGLRNAPDGAEPPRVARPRGVLDMYA